RRPVSPPPTRRSSDLPTTEHQCCSEGGPQRRVAGETHRYVQHESTTDHRCQSQPTQCPAHPLGHRQPWADGDNPAESKLPDPGEDRKSTRLNSRHVKT